MFIGAYCLKTFGLIIGQFISDHPGYSFQTLQVQNMTIMFIIDCSHKAIKHRFSFYDIVFLFNQIKNKIEFL